MEDCLFKDYFQSCKNCVEMAEIKLERAVDNINAASKIRKTNIIAEKGSKVHVDCRKRYINQKNLIAIKKQKTDDGYINTSSLRSNATSGFKYVTHCVLCEKQVVDSNGVREKEVHRVSSVECQNTLITSCESRDDDCAKKVKPNLSYISDYPAYDVHYHKQCFLNFINKKSIPKKFSTSNITEGKKGRPLDEEKLKALKMVIDDFYESEVESITVSELIKKNGRYNFSTL